MQSGRGRLTVKTKQGRHASVGPAIFRVNFLLFLVMAATGENRPHSFDFAVSDSHELVPSIDHDVLLSAQQ